MEFLLIGLFIFWFIPVLVLFRKRQTGWAWSGLIIGWAFAIVWFIAAIMLPDKRKAAEHREIVAAMEKRQLPAQVEQPTVEQRLADLTQLRSSGAISEEEFARLREKILEDI